MKVHNKFIKAFGALLIAVLLFGAMPAGEVRAAEINVDCSGGCDQTQIQTAIDSVGSGDIVTVSGGPIVFTAGVTVKTGVTLNGVGDPLIQVSGTGARFTMQDGSTLQGFQIEKTEKTAQNIIYVGSDNVSVLNNTIWGRYIFGDAETSRAFEVAYGSDNLTISGNTIYDLRQPGYLNGSLLSPTTGTISNNNVYSTRGWVLAGANMTYTGNTWGDGSNPNIFDIVILSGTDASYYPDILAVSDANNMAVVEDQRVSPAVLSVAYVDASAPVGGNGGAAQPYHTINEGITRVITGGTVEVAAGSYTGISANKPVTLLGPNASIHPAIGTHPTETVGTRGPEAIVGGLVPSADGITVDGFKFTKAGTRMIDTYADADNFTMRNCIVESTAYGATTGVMQFGGGSHTDMLIEFNLFMDEGDHTFYAGGGPYDGMTFQYNKFQGAGDSFFWTASALVDGVIKGNEFDGESGANSNTINIGQAGNLQLLDNRFHDNYYTGVQVGVIDGTISGNTFEKSYPLDTYWASDLELWGGQWGTAVSTNVTITGNKFYYNDITGEDDPSHGIRLRAAGTGSGIDGSTIHIYCNEFHDGGERTDAYAIWHQGDQTTSVDADSNYWGSTTPDFTGKFSGPVTYLPYNTDTTCGTPVYPPVHNITQDTWFYEIQPAIDAAVDDDEIEVGPGIYNESVNVDKGVTLQGPGMVETFTDSLVVDDWYTDRYEPGVFEVATFLGESVLKHGVLAADVQSNSFYNYQGKKFDITTTGPEQTWSIDLYVDPAWETGQANAGFWATGYDSEGNISAYPIVTWRSGGSDPAGFYSFDYINGGWLPLFEASADDYGKWHNFAMTYTVGTGVEYFVDGVSRLAFADPDTVKLTNIILNVYNFGEDYDVYWDNFGAWDAKVVGQMDIDASNVGVNGLILSNPGAPYGMQIDALVDTVDITENLFADIGSESLSANVKGIYLVHGSDNVTIENNLFERIFADAKSVNAIFSGDSTTTDPAEGLVIQDNRFQNITSQTKGGYGILLNNGAGNPAALIDGNRFSGISGGWTHAVGMEGPTLDAVVTDNTFYNLSALSADNSAVFFEVNPTGASVNVSGNRFQHVGYGVAIHPNDLPGGSNGLDYTVDASLNYWGSGCGPSPLAADAGLNVTYAPWYADVELTSQTSSGTLFGEVTFEAGSTLAYMQEQVTCAQPGTIFNYVEGETYPGGLIINRPGLTFKMNGATMGAGSPAYTVLADYTVINGPGLLDGGGSSDHAIVVADGVIDFTLGTVEITGWADGLHFNGVITDTVISDNFIHDNTGDAVYFGAQPVAQTDVSFYIQGNLFKHNGGDGVNNLGGTDINAEYNSWSDVTGADGTDGDGSTNADTDPFTHVDLYLVSTNPDIDNWPNQVFVDDSDPITPNDTITYQVKAHVVNLTGASFDLNFPTSLVSAELVSDSVHSQFSPVPGQTEEVTIASGVISFDGITGETPATVTPLTGDIVLFEVTFTGVAPGEAALDFDEDTDEFSMSPVGGGPSNNIYADELLDVTLDVITRPTLSADGIEGPYVAGTSHQINIETCNAITGGDWSESVADPIEPDAIAWVRISDVTIAEIASLQFLWEGGWYDFTVQGGPAVQQVGDDVIARFGNYDFGVEVPNNWCDYDAFRVTFVEPGFHDITIELYDMMDTSQDDIGGDDILLTYLGPITIEVLGDFEVTGTISMQGRTVRSGVPLTLTDVNGAPIYGPFTDDSGPELAFNVLFSPVNGGIYEITTLQPRYLNVTADLNKQFLVNSAYEIEPLELQGGNAIWTDNDIDINDASLVGAQYGWTGNTSTQDADVNFDDKVNIQDLALVGGNFDLDSATAYADWLLPEYNGYVEGVLNTSETGAISGSVAGDYNLTITGQLTEDYGTSIPNVAFFDGTVSGDFAGTITGGKVSNMGVDPLYAVIDVPGMTETVRIVGNFVKSGIGGHFKGQIITGDELDPVTSLTITGGDTVAVGDVLDLDVTILPATATDDVRWSIYIPSTNPGDATIDELTGEVTGVSPGNVTVVVITVDDSGMSYTNKSITVTAP